MSERWDPLTRKCEACEGTGRFAALPLECKAHAFDKELYDCDDCDGRGVVEISDPQGGVE